MTAAAQYQVTTATTVNTVTMNIVSNAAAAVKNAEIQFVLDVLINVPRVKNRSAITVLPNARNVKKCSVRIV